MVLHGNIFLSISALCSRIWIGTDYLNRNSLMSVEHHFECADGPALGPDGPRSGQSVPMGWTVRAGAEQIRVPSFLLCLLAKISG